MASIKEQVSNGPRQEQVSGCCVGLTPPETTNTEFFKYMETQAALKKSLSRFMQWSKDFDTVIKVMYKHIRVTEWKQHVWLKKKKAAILCLSFLFSFGEEEKNPAILKFGVHQLYSQI